MDLPRDAARIQSATRIGHPGERRIWNLLSYLPGPGCLSHASSSESTLNVSMRSRPFCPVHLLTLVLFLALSLILPDAARAQDAPLVVASGPLSERTMVLVGRTVQSPEQLQFFGYVNGASGLPAEALYTEDTDVVGNARFTFLAEVDLEPATNRADTTSFAGEGTLRVYLAADGGADWEDPASFSAGELLAEYDLALRETLQRQAVQVGVLVGDGSLTQTTANTFTLDETTYRFGVEGLGQRLRYTGGLTPDTSGVTLAAVVNGYAEVTNRDITVVRMGQTTTATGTPSAASAETPTVASDCVLEPWLSNATSALDVANQGLGNLDMGSISEVDTNAVQDLAAEIGAAIATLRGSAPPAEAADANRLLVTSLSTTARGLRGIAGAAASGDEAAFSQAAATLGDGQTLLTRVQGEIAQLAAACPAE
jgi:hypothetical protein